MYWKRVLGAQTLLDCAEHCILERNHAADHCAIDHDVFYVVLRFVRPRDLLRGDHKESKLSASVSIQSLVDFACRRRGVFAGHVFN